MSKNATHPLAEKLRNYDQCSDDDINAAADALDRLMEFIQSRVADKKTMLRGGYHARRICLEAEKLLQDELQVDRRSPSST